MNVVFMLIYSPPPPPPPPPQSYELHCIKQDKAIFKFCARKYIDFSKQCQIFITNYLENVYSFSSIF